MTAELLRVFFRVGAEEAEQARARLLTLVPAGFEERELGAAVELAVYVDAGTAERVLATFATADASPVQMGWEEEWRRFHRPVRAGGVWIGPPWEPPPPGESAVVIEPGRAFGTGAHATTRLCIEHLARLPPGRLLDVGCGSGVVGIAAAQLGYGPILAVDDDPVAVDCTLDNASRNGVEIAVARVDALSETLPAADVAVVNILLPAVESVLARLSTRWAVTSGYRASDQLSTPGWRSGARLELDGWAADALARDGRE
jgi:ribosomal protein L11 methyltransferase